MGFRMDTKLFDLRWLSDVNGQTLKSVNAKISKTVRENVSIEVRYEVICFICMGFRIATEILTSGEF